MMLGYIAARHIQFIALAANNVNFHKTFYKIFITGGMHAKYEHQAIIPLK